MQRNILRKSLVENVVPRFAAEADADVLRPSRHTHRPPLLTRLLESPLHPPSSGAHLGAAPPEAVRVTVRGERVLHRVRRDGGMGRGRRPGWLRLARPRKVKPKTWDPKPKSRIPAALAF